jgi:protein TonB
MFDRYVADTRPNWKRRAIIIASVGLHGIAAIVLIIWSFFHVEEIAPPAVSLTFFSAPPPPPPPPPPAKKKSVEHKVTPVEHKVVVPTQVNPIIQPKQEDKKEETSDDDDGVEGGEEGGVKGGVVGGVKGGVVGGTLGGVVGGTGTGATGKMVAAFTLTAQQVAHPLPHAPEWFTAQHPHQMMNGLYKVCLGNDGHVTSTSIVKALGGIDDQIMQQIKGGWSYKPQPVPVCFVANVQLKIN